MSEDVARAVGAGSTETVIIAGKQCQARPLGVRELTEVERECLKQYKRQVLETYALNGDLLPEAEAHRLLREKMDEVSLWDVSNLPPKFVVDFTQVKVNDAIIKWLTSNMGFTEKEDDGKTKSRALIDLTAKRMIAAAIDGNSMDAALYENLVGEPPRRQKVGYVNWWISGSYDGMITLVWICFKDNGVTRDEVAREIGNNPGILVNLSREIEHLSAAAVGNG